MIVHRLYQTLKEKTQQGEPFKRRVTWIENPTNEAIQTDVAIVEYTGDFGSWQVTSWTREGRYQ